MDVFVVAYKKQSLLGYAKPKEIIMTVSICETKFIKNATFDMYYPCGSCCLSTAICLEVECRKSM